MNDENTNQTLIVQDEKDDINNDKSMVEVAQELGGVIVLEYEYDIYQ
jgi:hypothetical protein